MSDSFMGEIRMMSFNFAPKFWAMCNGQTLSIQQNTALFALLGTFYGGNGTTTFNLPNLQGRTPLGMGSGFDTPGIVAGEVAHTLLSAEIPPHNHPMMVSASGALASASGANPAGNSPAVPVINKGGNVNIWGTGPISTSFSSNMVAPVGGLPHENRQPYLVLNFCICLQGIFPSRN